MIISVVLMATLFLMHTGTAEMGKRGGKKKRDNVQIKRDLEDFCKKKKKKKAGGKRMEHLPGKEKLWQKRSEGRLQSKGEINKETL